MTDTQFPSQTIKLRLEVISEDEQQIDIADIDEVGRGLFDQLICDGYKVQPSSTDKKGRGPLFDILLQIPQFLHENKDWLLGSIPPVLQCLLIARDRLAEREKMKQTPLKITFEVNGKPIVAEASDPKALKEVVKGLQTVSPEKTKIRAVVSKKKRRK